MALPPFFDLAGQEPRRSIENGKQEAFVKMKAICVPLLEAGRAPTSPDSTRSLLHFLKQLKTEVLRTSNAVFTSALANYIFFPLSTVLQPDPSGRDRSEMVLEATMEALDALISIWRNSPGGMDPRVLQELWIMGVLRLGGPLDPTGTNGKGKAKEISLSEETKFAIVKMLLSIMSSSSLEEQVPGKEQDENDDPLGEKIDWTADDPFSAASKTTLPIDLEDEIPPDLPPIPILFHTLTTLTALAESPSSFLKLQLSALQALRVLFERFLVQRPPIKTSTSLSIPKDSTGIPAGPSPLVATALPGTASALSRVALSIPRSSAHPIAHQARRQASAAVVASIELLEVIIILAVADNITTSLRRSDGADLGGATLEELADESIGQYAVDLQKETQTSLPRKDSMTDAIPERTGPTIPTPAWLRHTISNLTTLFVGLSGLSSHDSPQVRVTLAHLLEAVLLKCGEAFGDSRGLLLECLLLLSNDDWEDVTATARAGLVTLFDDKHGSNIPLAADSVRKRLLGLPSALLREDERTIGDSARIIVAALRSLPTLSSSVTRFLIGIERWSWSFLRALDFSKIVGANAPNSAGMAQAWITTGNFEEESEVETPWPMLNMRNVKDEKTKYELDVMWLALGRWASNTKQSEFLVDQFLGVATGARSREGVAVSALSVLDAILRGMQEGGEESKATKKVVRGVVRSVLEILESLELEILEDESQPDDTPEQAAMPAVGASSDTSLIEAEISFSFTVEHQQAVSLTPGLDNLKPVTLTSTDLRASHIALTACFCLRLLSTSASILTSSFQPYLLQALYHILSYLSPTSHPLLRRHSQLALARIAYWTSYASPQNLVLANVDYVVNSVSQRLSISRLNPAAPLVLVEMIRLVGEPILPMVQDLVEDVFEALDDYHGYEELTLGLWGVLDALMRVMSGTVDAVTEEEQAHPSQNHPPNPEDDWNLFCDWHAQRDKPKVEEEEEEVPTNPQEPFASKLSEDTGAEFPSDTTPPATRTQLVGAQVLSKSLYFLSHSSPFLRSRVLSLIASAVPLFATSSTPAKGKIPSDRQSDLLPIIHRAWPFILNRLADVEPHVVLEAAGLIESLAIYLGEFMSRRILDDVWPRFRTILARQSAEDQKSAIAGQSPYTVSHRIYRTILSAMLHVGRSVPLKETVVWDQAVLFRHFLDAGLDPELQTATKAIYTELGRVNQEIVWLVLSAGVRSAADVESPVFLRMEKYDIVHNVELVLSDLNL